MSTTEIIKKEYTEEQKLRAAYALNMCMVSVSQIVDYNDEYILEQEYEAILNNLNLEQMPKDEALLNTLRELLDTITFFRIYEKKKNMIDKRYQQRVKNAIWNAVPNFGLLIAGGNPVSMAVSLASSVGIGYMNYRREKAQNELDYENELMELQITAIEQLNALRRELFTTSWRLADEYGFSDSYRLTERQIKQYNEILMDQDPIRKYQRLDTIKENFKAYPAFWYFIGNAANQISNLISDEYPEKFKDDYRQIAIDHFDYYFKMNEGSILREDQLVASCALEYFELLPDSETAKKKELLDKAIKWSGMKSDILQICAVDYLRLKEYTEAEKLFRVLVNEGYNSDINAQILSSIYAFHYFEAPSDTLLLDYSLLSKQQNNVALFPLPVQENEGKSEIQLWDNFILKQMGTIQEFYNNALRSFFTQYAVEMNGLIMRFDPTITYPNSFFLKEGKKRRAEEVKRVMNNGLRRATYIESLSDINYSTAVVEILNRMLIGLQKLPFLNLDEPVSALSESISKVTSVFENIQEHITTGSIDEELYNQAFEAVEFSVITGSMQELIFEKIRQHLNGINDMNGIIVSEATLQKFCEKNNVNLVPEAIDDYENNSMLDPYRLDPALVGKTALSLDRENQYRKLMLDKLKSNLEGTLKVADKVGLFYDGTEEFASYFNSIVGSSSDKELLRQQAIAVMDDKRFLGDTDLVFTFNSVIPIRMKLRHTPASYEEIQWKEEQDVLDMNGVIYNNPNVSVKKLGLLLQDIAQIRKEFDEEVL